jgi:8-oxo-dGTP pyrophosphatase MutT (NUDIX family)
MKATIPVFVFLVDAKNRVYLQRRYNTGYLDGFYETPAGKMDEGEFPKPAACREAYEEAGITVNPESLELFHSYMNLSHGNPWLGLMFRTHTWQGIPTIQEPEKCDDAAFFALDNLPKLTPQVRDGIQHVLGVSKIAMNTYDNINKD